MLVVFPLEQAVLSERCDSLSDCPFYSFSPVGFVNQLKCSGPIAVKQREHSAYY